MNPLKVFKIFASIILALLIVLIQVSFINNLARPFNNFSLILTLIFFVVILVNYQLGFYLAFIGGIFLEVYSPMVFGGIFIPLALMVIIINFLFNLFFTNRSLYPLLILGAAGIIIFHLFNFIILNLFYWFNLSKLKIEFSGHYLSDIGWQILLVLAALSIIFILLYYFSKRFKSVFLAEGRR